jgi:hypothetical protein
MIPVDFKGAALPRSADIYAQIADRYGIEEPVVRAVVSVEAGGAGFLADGRPKILFERHVFHRLTAGRWDAADREISGPSPGGYRGGAVEYDRLARAIQLDRDSALRSASWGLGQIMGFNAVHAGYGTIEGFVEAMCAGEDLQLWAFAEFVRSAGLADELDDRRWAEFAAGYNGPGYARNQYDTKLVAAYAKAVQAARVPANDDVRPAVAEVQALLCLAGYAVVVDGWDGPKTRAALRRFQIDHGLTADGVAGKATRAALLALAPTPPRRAA